MSYGSEALNNLLDTPYPGELLVLIGDPDDQSESVIHEVLKNRNSKLILAGRQKERVRRELQHSRYCGSSNIPEIAGLESSNGSRSIAEISIKSETEAIVVDVNPHYDGALDLVDQVDQLAEKASEVGCQIWVYWPSSSSGEALDMLSRKADTVIQVWSELEERRHAHRINVTKYRAGKPSETAGSLAFDDVIKTKTSEHY